MENSQYHFLQSSQAMNSLIMLNHIESELGGYKRLLAVTQLAALDRSFRKTFEILINDDEEDAPRNMFAFLRLYESKLNDILQDGISIEIINKFLGC